MRLARSLTALVVGPLLVLASGAAPATAETMLAVGSRATLVARGVAVDVVLTYRCSAGADVQTVAALELTQPVGHGGYTSAWSNLDLVCDTVTRTSAVRLGVEDWDTVIRPGTAMVHVEMWSYVPDGPSAQVWQEVRVTRKSART